MVSFRETERDRRMLWIIVLQCALMRTEAKTSQGWWCVSGESVKWLLATGTVWERHGTLQWHTIRATTQPLPRSVLPHCTVRCHGNSSERHFRASASQFSFALRQVQTIMSCPEHRLSSVRLLVVFLRWPRLLLVSCLKLFPGHFPSHYFQLIIQ